MAMGGTSQAMRSNLFVNPNNPASYTALDTNSFVFEGGVVSRNSTFETNTFSEEGDYSSLGYLVFGFPLAKKWKASMGLLPVSGVGYTIANTAQLENIGSAEYVFEGSGGINQVYFGQAIEVVKGLSLGVNAAYLFGTMDQSNAVTFPDSSNYLNYRLTNSTKVSDFRLTYGLQYETNLKSGLRLISGLTYANSTNISAKRSSLGETFKFGSDGITFPRDTLVYSPDAKGEIVLPDAYGAGLALQKPGKWLLSADYEWQNWEKYRNFGEKDSLQNSMRASLGFEILPSNSILDSYWKKIKYRMGLRYEKSYLQLQENQINEFGISFGAGLPLRKTRSTLNVAFEVGQRGTTNSNLIKENFFQVTLGFAIFEYWFIQRRYE